LGATWDGEGVNFTLFSEHAEQVELCLFDRPNAGAETDRIPVLERTNSVWHVYLPDVRPGQLYGYRVYGPYDPNAGHRFNPAKLLSDPYAKGLSGPVRWDDAVFGYQHDHADGDLSRDDRDSSAYMPKSIVVDTAFTWGEDRPPRTPWGRTVIYEAHVKGMTARHPSVPEHLRGTYLGLASDAILEHLDALGVTAVELMPVHHAVTEHHLATRGLTNYWGYNTLGFFAPDARYGTGAMGEQVNEFKTMVKALHRAGMEVILDVVYNHTAEGNHLGPTLSFRGIDNASYYMLDPQRPRHYRDFTGTGNTLNMGHPQAMQLMMDSLRYWVREMHVDGFRFDLAPALARSLYESHRLGWFFDVIQQDPILAEVKLIAEPWDVGEGGYHVGRFPPGWAEWNGRYRDTVRKFWRGDDGHLADLGYRVAGSSDLYNHRGRSPHASINFVTSHDGFTLNDLVSYAHKHNEANGEDNRDGDDANWSHNWGVEGPTDRVETRRLRDRMKRNFLATLAFSQGVPMLSHGDEIGRTQGGNNNGYGQDNETAWVDWDMDARDRDLLAFVREIMRIRHANPVFRRRSFFQGRPSTDGMRDVTWLGPSGEEMTEAEWTDPAGRVLGMLVNGEATEEVDERGRPIMGDTVILLINGGETARAFALPGGPRPGTWMEQINTGRSETRRKIAVGAFQVAPRSLVLLKWDE
jgi:glycogen operon protein